MPKVHVFASTDLFAEAASLERFVMPAYNDDGDEIPSEFMRETGLKCHEPACIERIHSKEPKRLTDLLAGASYGASWLAQASAETCFRSAVCVYPPNVLTSPARSSMVYLGAYDYEV
jgi:hypothetical protein